MVSIYIFKNIFLSSKLLISFPLKNSTKLRELKLFGIRDCSELGKSTILLSEHERVFQ